MIVVSISNLISLYSVDVICPSRICPLIDGVFPKLCARADRELREGGDKPETLKELDTVQRLIILCKLMPYVLPKTESVKHTFGEPEPPKKNWFEI